MPFLDALSAHLSSLAFPRNPITHVEQHERTREYLREALAQMGRECTEQCFTAELENQGGMAVRGVNLLGHAPKQARALLVSHYDTVDHSPGADDNLSAVAVALEVAKACPQVAVLFPDLEEFGLKGSRHFVADGTWSDLPALVLESVGYMSSEPGSQSYPGAFPLLFPGKMLWLKKRRSRGNFWALLHLDNDAALAKSLVKALGSEVLDLSVPSALLSRKEASGLRDFGRSDHLAFWEKGRSCLMLTDSANFRNPNYHKPSDLPETLDLQALDRLVGMLCRWLDLTFPIS